MRIPGKLGPAQGGGHRWAHKTGEEAVRGVIIKD